MRRQRIIPATGLAWMLPWYDPLVRICTNERQFRNCMLDVADLRPSHRVLDLGCGTGRDVYLAAYFAGESGHVIGVDMTEEQLDVARRHLDSQTARFGGGC